MKRIFACLLMLSLALTALPVWAEEGMVTVTFDLNGAEAAMEPLTVAPGTVIAVEQVPIPERAGYWFTGWYTVREPAVVDGVPQDEWILGNKYVYGTPQPGETVSMPVTEDVTLYARWAAPVEIHTAEELFAMRNDLTGWYVLANDLDLTGMTDWQPIGTYHGEYEMANPEWWPEAFRGHFDGNGHTIKGLTITNRQGFGAALFQAAANATIENLTVEDYRIEIENALSLNAAPVAGLSQGARLMIRNCHTSGTIHASLDNPDNELIFISVTGMVSEAWGGTIEGCTASGTLDVSAHVKNGAEVSIGGFNGEGYAAAVNCRSNMDISVSVVSDAKGETDQRTELYVGGIQAGATVVTGCSSEGSITASLQKPTGNCAIAVGGIVGEERYNNVDNCRSDMRITVEEGRSVYAGGLVGRYNTGTYGMIGFFFGITENRLEKCLTTSSITLAEGYEREEAIVGPAVSSLPKGGMTAYVMENIAALDTGFTAEEGSDTVRLYASADDMTGDTLRDVLGDGWTYANCALPMPKP